MQQLLKDFALPLLLILLGAGGLGSLLVSRLVPQRRSPDEKFADLEAKVVALESKDTEKDELIERLRSTINAQADYILVIRTWGIDGQDTPFPPYPDNLKAR